MSPLPPAPRPNEDTLRAVCLLAIDPHGLGGAVLRGPADPRRVALFAGLQRVLPATARLLRLPHGADDAALAGGVDLVASLAAGRRVVGSSLLARADGGVLVVPLADRLDPGRAALIAAALESGEVAPSCGGAVRTARFGVIACDEGTETESESGEAVQGVAASLADRLAFRLEIGGVALELVLPTARRFAAARARLGAVTVPARAIRLLCAAAEALGIASMRAPILAMRAARASAALAGRKRIGPADLEFAARMVLAPRATRLPAMEEAPEDVKEQVQEQPAESDPTAHCPQDPADDADRDAQDRERTDSAMEDRLVEAARSALPADLLARLTLLASGGATARGSAPGATRPGLARGRPCGVRPGVPRGGARLALIDTIRAAAPYQRMRAPAAPHGRRLHIRAGDLRVHRVKEPVRSLAIFAVDASGSSALHRLAEAKGAVQLLLGEAYRRREQVAVIAFRDRAATCLLPPTAALARARRALAGLPGGGPTPLASGIDSALALALAEQRRGVRPLLVLLTDGGGNIGRDGVPGRAQARHDACAAAESCRRASLAGLVIDTSPRPSPLAAEIARHMGVRHLPLPHADADAVSRAVRQERGGR